MKIILTLALVGAFFRVCFAQTPKENAADLPQLSGEFTLRYDVTAQDVSSSELRQATIAYQEKIYGMAVKRGNLSQKEATRKYGIVAGSLDQSEPTQRFTVILSSKDNKLLYLRDDQQTQSTLLCDGKTVFEYDKGKNANGATIYSGSGFLSKIVLPLPGASLPLVPLIENTKSQITGTNSLRLLGKSPIFNRGYSPEIPYLPSQTEIDTTGGTSKVLSCSLKLLDSSQEKLPAQKWEFQNHISFKNVNIPQRLIFTDYASYESQGKRVEEPIKVITFQLLEAKPSALLGELFDQQGRLHTGDAVQDCRAIDKCIAFIFRPNRGSLEEQIDHARLKQERRARDENGKSRGNKLAGTFLLAALACGLGARFWRRRQSSGSSLPSVDRSNKK